MRAFISKLIIGICSLCFVTFVHGQVSVSILPGSLNILPSNTVNNSSTFTVQGTVVNTGTAAITGTVTLKMAINTSTTSTPAYVFRTSSSYPVSTFQPSASQNFSLADIASSSNQYNTGIVPGTGNGTTVVVWPVLSLPDGSTIVITDSVYDEIFVIVPDNVEDLMMEKSLIKIKNPVSQTLELVYNALLYRVELKDMDGRFVKTIDGYELNTSGLAKGMYYLSFHNLKSGNVLTRKVVIE